MNVSNWSDESNNNGPNGHLFYVGGDLMMRRGMLPIIMLPDGDLRIVLHLEPFWILTILGSVQVILRYLQIQTFVYLDSWIFM